MPIKRPGVKKSIRTRILLRDEYNCRKCGRRESLNIHHIQAVMDGGSDEDDNLITLCVPCHREWELAEMCMEISFDVWLSQPPYSALLSVFLCEDRWKTDMPASDVREAILQAHKLTCTLRSSFLWLDEMAIDLGYYPAPRPSEFAKPAPLRVKIGKKKSARELRAEKIATVRKLYDARCSVDDICEVLEISPAMLYRYLKETEEKPA